MTGRRKMKIHAQWAIGEEEKREGIHTLFKASLLFMISIKMHTLQYSVRALQKLISQSLRPSSVKKDLAKLMDSNPICSCIDLHF